MINTYVYIHIYIIIYIIIYMQHMCTCFSRSPSVDVQKEEWLSQHHFGYIDLI